LGVRIFTIGTDRKLRTEIARRGGDLRGKGKKRTLEQRKGAKVESKEGTGSKGKKPWRCLGHEAPRRGVGLKNKGVVISTGSQGKHREKVKEGEPGKK